MVVNERGTKLWYLNDELHREAGPAVEWANGFKFWYLNGIKLIRPKEFETMEAWLERE